MQSNLEILIVCVLSSRLILLSSKRSSAFIPILQSNRHIESFVYLHAVRVHYSNLLEAESRTGYSCSIPLNIIIGVDRNKV